MGCGSTRSNSTTEIVQLRPFPIDSKSKLPNEALEGFGRILKLQGAPLKPNQDTRKKPGKFEPGSNVYSNVIKDSTIKPRFQLNKASDSNQGIYDIKLQEPAQNQQSQVDIQLPIHIEEQISSHLLDASKGASKSQSYVQSRRRSVGEEVEKPSADEERDVIPEKNESRVLVYNEKLNDFQDPDEINYVENVRVVKLIGEPESDYKQFKVEDQAGIDGDISPVNSERDQSQLEIDPKEEIQRLEELRKHREVEAQAHAARKNASLRQAELDALSSLTSEVDRAKEIVSKYE